MVKIFEKIQDLQRPEFTMPLSLRIIKESCQNNIDWKYLHIADLLSIIYSIRIDNAKLYLQQQRNKRLQEKGISSITKATEEDFDNL